MVAMNYKLSQILDGFREVTGGVDANRLRGGLKPRPLEPDPDHAGVGKMMTSQIDSIPPYFPVCPYRRQPPMLKGSTLTITFNDFPINR